RVLSSAMLLAASKTIVRCLTRSLQAASRGGRWAGAVSAERKLQLRLHMVLLAGMAVALLPGEATADSSEEGIAFFEKSIRPLLVKRCYACHSAEAEAKGELQAGLALDTKQGLLEGGESGPALVPG